MSKQYPPRFYEKKFMDSIRNPEQFLLGNLDKFPDILHFKFLTREVYIVQSPTYVKSILQDNHKAYKKSRAFQILELLLGKGLVTSEGDFWKRQRRLAQPAFHKKRLGRVADITVKRTQETIDSLKELQKKKEPINLTKHFAKLTIDIVSEALFGADVSDDVQVVWEGLEYANVLGINRIRNPFALPHWVPTPSNRKLNFYLKEIDRVVLGIIEQRRKTPGEYHDLLAMLMDVQDEDTGERMSNRQIRDEVMTIFVAGHETTVNALSWTFYLLGKHPEAKAKGLAELAPILKGQTPTFETIFQLPYTTQIIKESMRLFPPAYAIPREAKETTTLKDFHVAKGLNLVLNVVGIHRHPKYWDAPNEFRPERFKDFKPKGDLKYIYFPFGGGPRMCIGNNFAMMEMQLILAMFLQQMDWTLTKECQEIEKDFMITLRPKGGVWVKFE